MSAVSPSPGFRRNEETPPGVSAPSAGLRPLGISRGSGPCRGHSVLPCVGNDMPSMLNFYKNGGFDIGLPETRRGRDRVLSFKVRGNQRRNGPCPVPRNFRLESSVPAINLNRGRNQLRRDAGVRRCLARSLTSLALLLLLKGANGPRSNSFRPVPPHDILSRGRKTQTAPRTRHEFRSDASSTPQLNLHFHPRLTSS